jgi:hypothetical protein
VSQYPPVAPTGFAFQPHRGAVVLTLGILGLMLCFILGIIAWVMGAADLRAMREGRMDPAGKGITQAGQICGIVSVAMWCIILAIWVIMAVFMLFAATAGAAAAAGAAGASP